MNLAKLSKLMKIVGYPSAVYILFMIEGQWRLQQTPTYCYFGEVGINTLILATVGILIWIGIITVIDREKNGG